jgi:hypothetical protein
VKINTAFGKRSVIRRAGTMGEYYQTMSTPSAPNGAWWTLNPQRGFVPVPSNAPALLEALARGEYRS